jgi:hypothetical protein
MKITNKKEMNEKCKNCEEIAYAQNLSLPLKKK